MESSPALGAWRTPPARGTMGNGVFPPHIGYRRIPVAGHDGNHWVRDREGPDVTPGGKARAGRGWSLRWPRPLVASAWSPRRRHQLGGSLGYGGAGRGPGPGLCPLSWGSPPQGTSRPHPWGSCYPTLRTALPPGDPHLPLSPPPWAPPHPLGFPWSGETFLSPATPHLGDPQILLPFSRVSPDPKVPPAPH